MHVTSHEPVMLSVPKSVSSSVYEQEVQQLKGRHEIRQIVLC